MVAAPILFLWPKKVRPVEIILALGKLEPALRHHHQKFTVGWISRLA